MARLSELPNVAITLVFIGVVFVAGFLVMAGLGDSTSDTDATAAIGNVTSGLTNIVTYAPTWGVIIGA